MCIVTTRGVCGACVLLKGGVVERLLQASQVSRTSRGLHGQLIVGKGVCVLFKLLRQKVQNAKMGKMCNRIRQIGQEEINPAERTERERFCQGTMLQK